MALARHPEIPETSEQRPDIEALASAYRLIADCFVYPENIDRDEFVEKARADVLPQVTTHLDTGAAEHLSAFLDAYEGIDTEEYVETLELDPSCPLYLGHYEFDEPETCRDIADADRNQYMVELNGIYEHFGFELEDELPDFVPAMVEFLWLTIPERDDGLRAEFASRMLSMLPGMIEQFEQAESPYREPLEALETVLRYDLEHVMDVDGDAVPKGGEN